MDWTFSLILVFLLLHNGTTQECNDEWTRLGMKPGSGGFFIEDAQITSSSHKENAEGYHGRADTTTGFGAWCPLFRVSEQPLEYLQIDFQRMVNISYLETQGRFSDGLGVEFTPQYSIDYQRTMTDEWIHYRNDEGTLVFDGNIDERSGSYHRLVPNLQATRVRIIPLALQVPTDVCLRVEFYGCETSGVAAYSIPEGNSRGDSFNFIDRTYDGEKTLDGKLRGGLGLLTDRQLGESLFKEDRGTRWVGWRNDVISGPVILNFTFETYRNISRLDIHANNQYSKDVRIFRTALVYASNGGTEEWLIGRRDFGRDDTFEESTIVVVPIESNNRPSLSVRIVLEFEGKWILISEVTFTSTIIPEETTTIAPVVDMTPTSLINEAPVEETTSSVFIVHDKTTSNVKRFSDGDVTVASTDEGPAKIDANLIGAVVGACCGLILIVVMIVFACCLYQRRRRKPSTPTHDNRFNPALQSPAHQVGTMKSYNGIPQCDSEKTESIDYDQPWSRPLPHLPMTNGTGSPCQGHSSGYMSDGPQYACIPIAGDTMQGFSLYDQSHMHFQQMPANGRTLPSNGDIHSRHLLPHNTLPVSCHMTHVMSNQAYDTLQPTSPYDVSNYRSGSNPLPNIQGASGGSMYGTHNSPLTRNAEEQVSLTDIPRNNLRFLEKLGSGQYGEVHLCELLDFSSPNASAAPTLVAVKMIQNEANEQAKNDFYREIRILSRLQDNNIVQVLGISSPPGGPLCVVTEYMPHGDLHQFLQRHAPENSLNRTDNSIRTLTRGCLLYMATQIASGMRYLEQLNVTHRDLATRNCLVGENYQVKISDFGMSRSLYSKQYYKVEGRVVLPIRWMAWESILLGTFTTKSDVWSFGVTLWEIFTFAREQPFSALSDDEVIANCMNYYNYNTDAHNIVTLQQPPNCHKEVYDLLRACWGVCDSSRPSFNEIHLFLQRKNLGYTTQDEKPLLTTRLTTC